MTNEFFKRKYTDIQMVYYVHFSKRIGYGVAVVATIPYPEKLVLSWLSMYTESFSTSFSFDFADG